MRVVYFSNYSENTKRFVEKLGVDATRIPIRWYENNPLIVDFDYVLIVPTYGGGNENHTVPKQVVKFLNIPENRSHLKAVIGTGNTNFGSHYCRASEIISAKTGVPVLYKLEITGTPEDVLEVNKRMETL